MTTATKNPLFDVLPHQIFTGTTWHARYKPAKHNFSYPYRYWGLSLKKLVEGDLPEESEWQEVKRLAWFKKLGTLNNKLNNKLNKLFSIQNNAVHSFNFADYCDIDKLDDSNINNADYKKGRTLPKAHFKQMQRAMLKKIQAKQARHQTQEQAKAWLAQVQQEFTRLTGSQPTGDILALVVSRNLGFYFSPVNFYLGFDNKGNASHLLAEVSNTPWNKRHFYGFALAGNNSEFTHHKEFHVSPFNPLDQVYNWKVNISTPNNLKSQHIDADDSSATQLKNIKLSIHISDDRGKVFAAGINLHSQLMTPQNLRQSIQQNPIMNYSSMARIYWHALILYVVKKVPYISYNQTLHANNKSTSDTSVTSVPNTAPNTMSDTVPNTVTVTQTKHSINKPK